MGKTSLGFDEWGNRMSWMIRIGESRLLLQCSRSFGETRCKAAGMVATASQKFDTGGL